MGKNLSLEVGQSKPSAVLLLKMVACRYFYFIQKASRYSAAKCLRVAASDPRIPELQKQYAPIGWTVVLNFHSNPTVEEEIFQLKMRHRTWWDCDVHIEDINEKKPANYAEGECRNRRLPKFV